MALPAGVLDAMERSSKKSSAPDDGRKHRPKHVELTRNSKINLRSCILLVVFVINFLVIN